jgi:hypothetical protein
MSKNSPMQNASQFQEWLKWVKKKYSIIIKPKKPQSIEDFDY